MKFKLVLILLWLPACYRAGVLKADNVSTDQGETSTTNGIGGTQDSGDPTVDTSSGDSSSGGTGLSDLPSMPTEAPELVDGELGEIKTLQLTWSEVDKASEYQIYEKPASEPMFSPLATSPETLARLYVFLYAAREAEYAVRGCNAAGCGPLSNSFTPTGDLSEGVGFIKSEEPTAAGIYATSVAVSDDGTRLAVGAPGEVGGGRVHVYTQDAGEWTSTGVLESNEGVWFGASLAMTGDGKYLAVGDMGSNSVSMYALDSLALLQAQLEPANVDTDDEFGAALAMTDGGELLVIGAPGEDSSAVGVDGDSSDNGSTNAGAVYVFERSNDDLWQHQTYIKTALSQMGARFGTSVDVNDTGDMIVGGAPYIGAGSVYVFGTFNQTWQQQGVLSPESLGDSGDQFGYAVSENNGYVAVGAPLEDSASDGIDSNADNLSTNAGAVYLFDTDSTLLHYVKATNSGISDQFGESVVLTEDLLLAVGAPNEDSDAAGFADSFGADVASDSGAVYIISFAEEGSVTYVKPPHTAIGSQFGYTLGLASDALVVGAPLESRADAGISPELSGAEISQSGALYLY